VFRKASSLRKGFGFCRGKMKLSASEIVKTQESREHQFREKPLEKKDDIAMWRAQLEAATSISNPELRLREENYVKEKLKKAEKAQETRAREEQGLKDADAKRKKDDSRIRGFQSSGV
jgi:hypothetical protein